MESWPKVYRLEQDREGILNKITIISIPKFFLNAVFLDIRNGYISQIIDL